MSSFDFWLFIHVFRISYLDSRVQNELSGFSWKNLQQRTKARNNENRPVSKLTHILYDKWSKYLFSKIISFRRYLYLCVHIIVCSNTLEISVTCKCRTARCNHLKEKCHSKTGMVWSLNLHYLHYLHHCQIR